jgi:hypothetical protein
MIKNKVIKYNKFIKENKEIELSYYSFDWDDNLLHMPTVIHMDKLIDGEWVPKDVSTSEFAIVRNDKENYRLRNNNLDEAFSEFRDNGPRGSNAFLIDVKNALSNNYFGPSWDSFINCLREGAIFSIITARGHEPNTIRKGVEYIIDNFLSKDDCYMLYNNCLRHSYLFLSDEEFDRIPKGQFSKTPLISKYLDLCDFYGVSSLSFAKEFGEGSASDPEHAKKLALEKFIDKCNNFGKTIGAKSVSIGFSDDDPKNVEHVRKFFKERSALENEFDHKLKLSLFKTTDRSIKGGETTKFHEASGSTIAPGMESSVMSFTQYNNMASRLFPSDTKENDPVLNTHKAATNFLNNKSKEWTKDLKKNYLKKKLKKN